ncbi:DNA polymerase I, partial [Staphylococcus caprae]
TYIAMKRSDIAIQNIVFDTMLASYIIDPSRTIDDVQSVMTHFDETFVQDDVSIYGKGKTFHIPEDDVLDKHIATILDAIHVVQPQMMTILEN